MAGARARELGIKVGIYPAGEHSAITDVPGVAVGHVTLIEGEGALSPGLGPVRTGVTAITVVDREAGLFHERVPAGGFVLNGAGEMTGFLQVQEWGLMESPILLTNTMSVGRVRDAVLSYLLDRYPEIGVTADPVIPVVAECDDSFLNDIRGRHVSEAHVQAALAAARDGPVAEGNVGGGTGLTAFDFKGGIGTSSRVVSDCGGYRVGTLAMTNYGRRRQLSVLGVPVGRMLADRMPNGEPSQGSVIIILATDAPLSAQQLSQLSRRAALGLGRTGSIAAPASGELILAFSTAARVPRQPQELVRTLPVIHQRALEPFYEATVESVEEAVLNSLLAAETMTGRDGHTVHALDHGELLECLGRCGALGR